MTREPHDRTAQSQSIDHGPDGAPDVLAGTQTLRPARVRRVTIAAASVALVTILGGGAVAMASGRTSVGQAGDVQAPATTSQDTSDAGTDDGYLGPGYDPRFVPGSDPSYGYGPWGYDAGTGTSTSTATDATASQSAGLVEITSTLTNGQAAGTGLIWSSTGVVVTNHHVVAGATSVKVTVVSTGQTYTARYVGADSTADVAVLRLVGASGLDAVDQATAAAQVGDDVTAIGDANGDGGTLTAVTGTVAATDQDITVQDDSGGASALSDLIEIDADVVPGDSGGAVLDDQGDVVGMTVAASSGGVDVTGYAIPIADVESVVDQILAGQDTASIDLGYGGYLGVALDPSSTAPVVEQALTGGAAADAGISAGDTITTVGGTTISTVDQLRAVLADTSPGSRVRVTWTTADGSTRSAIVTLGRAPIA